MKKHAFEINVKWVNDESPDLSYLGEYKHDCPKVAYIDRKHNLLVVPSREIKEARTEEREDEINDLELSYTWDDDFLYYPYFQELPYSFNYERGDYQYIEMCNYAMPTEEEYKYIIEDGKRLREYERNNIVGRGCIVTASLNGIELGSGSCWGYSSDMTEEDDQDVVKDLTAEAIAEAEKNLEALKKA